ncbi:hypothetical protein JL721_10746 [Aureococcus anophagefferens]|nr:hypothetical protein JL721_10746 [Aureococcus anophagefferens]
MGGNLSATEFRARHQGPWAANFKERLLRWEDKGFTGSLSDGGLGQILYYTLASCCHHAKQINDRRAASGKSRYHATHMSNRYRNNPLTDLTGPFVPRKGQSYFRVEFLANTKAHNYVLSRLRRVLNSMQTHAEERTNAADGTPGRCLATLEELVNKAATQKLICPTTKVPIFNEAWSRADSNKHRFRRASSRPTSPARAWGKPDWYFFEVVCGRSDTVVDCGMTTVPETYALKQPAAHRDLRELLRQGKLPPPLPAEDPPAKRSRVVEPSATPARAARAPRAGRRARRPAAARAAVARPVLATPASFGGPPAAPSAGPMARFAEAKESLERNRAPSIDVATELAELTSQMDLLKVKIRQLESQRDQLETEQGQLTAARPGLVLQLNGLRRSRPRRP